MSHIVIQDALYTAKSVRQLDALALQAQDIPSITLMKRAGRAAFNELLAEWGTPEHVTVFCGAGNNAGDGYIVAALAADKGIPVRVVELSAIEKLSADAATAREFCLKAGAQFEAFEAGLDVQEGVIVDALLDRGPFAECDVARVGLVGHLARTADGFFLFGVGRICGLDDHDISLGLRDLDAASVFGELHGQRVAGEGELGILHHDAALEFGDIFFVIE